MNQQEQIKVLEDRIAKLEQTLNLFVRADRYVFDKPVMGEVRGLKLAQTGGKLGFFGKEPAVIYPTSFNGTASASYGGTEQNIINALQSALLSYGLIKP